MNDTNMGYFNRKHVLSAWDATGPWMSGYSAPAVRPQVELAVLKSSDMQICLKGF